MHADTFNVTRHISNVTRHISGTLISRRTGTMIHAAPEKDAALHVYSMIKHINRTAVALWRPDGSLISMKTG